MVVKFYGRTYSYFFFLFQAWVLTCIFFVFGALLEYSVILLHLKIYSLKLALPNSAATFAHTNALAAAAAAVTGNGNSMPQLQPRGDAASAYTEKMMRQNRIVSRFDLVCLVVFPIIFVLFTLGYILGFAL
jgi:hypothetical protein